MKPLHLSPLMLLYCFLQFQPVAKAQTLAAIRLISGERKTNCEFIYQVGSIEVSVDQHGRIRLNYDAREPAQFATAFDADAIEGRPIQINGVPIKYYNQFDMDNLGKVKSIGDINIAYYDRFDLDNKGKVKSIGTIRFTYFDRFDMDNQGKIKMAGNIPVSYYDRFDMSNKGNIKSIGNSTITYYDDFDDRSLIGRIKAIRGNTPKLFVETF
ncbi:hypothetical protein MUY27_13195 [Mucilaginibacter sp. RS28]|uniref:Uncharacterized protein n=1 Tax=Mucilaginibacter straminoryzae TaxID=2932774 RepID=A0A9X1X502_9SPHI|nr:hypothetical protein [Mucilaginibacter straminoryzae]MCJ8210666.1 hypothetical protein [Mucilaginibacter straminoryzae]